MKIKKIYTIFPIINSKDYHKTLTSEQYSIEYVQEMNGYLVDKKILVPASNVIEVLVEPEIEEKPKAVKASKEPKEPK